MIPADCAAETIRAASDVGKEWWPILRPLAWAIVPGFLACYLLPRWWKARYGGK